MWFCRDKGSVLIYNRNVIFAFVILFVVAAIRFDVGNDYAEYARDCIYRTNYFSSGHSLIDGIKYFDDIEFAHIFFCWLLQDLKYPFVGLYIIYSLIQVGILYYILKRENEFYWGLFIFIIGEFMFCSWDALRQFTAVLIVVLGYAFVEKNKFFKFLLCLGFAWLFHHSSIFMLFAFLLRYVKINRWILVGVLVSVTLAAVSGVLQQYQEQVGVYFDLLEGFDYSVYGSNAAMTVVATSMAYRLRLLLVGVIYTLILVFYPKGKIHNEILLTIGTALFIFANNSITLMRISWYFWTVVLVMVGPSFAEMKKRNYGVLKVFVIASLLFIFSHDVMTGNNTRGCQVYTTIFNNDLSRLPQRD